MRLVGASNLFIQLPFMLEGADRRPRRRRARRSAGCGWRSSYLVQDWLGQSVPWIPYVGTSDVLAIAPLLVVVAFVLAGDLVPGHPEPIHEGMTMPEPRPHPRRPAPGGVALQAVVALLAALAVAAAGVRRRGRSGRRPTTCPTSVPRPSSVPRRRDQRAADLAEAIEELSGELAAALTRLAEVEAQLPAAQAALDAAVAAAQAAQREAEILAARLQAAQDEEAAIVEQIAVDDAREQEIRVAIGQMAREAYKGGRDVVRDERRARRRQLDQDFVEKYGLVSTALRTQTQVLDELTAGRQEQERPGAAGGGPREGRRAEGAADVRSSRRRGRRRRRRRRRRPRSSGWSPSSSSARPTSSRAGPRREAQVAANDAERAKVASELAAIVEAQRVQREQEEAAACAPPARTATAVAVVVAAGRWRQPQPGGARPGALFANPTAHNPMVVTSEYGNRLHPVLGYWRLHAGIDLRDRCGEPVYAARSGTVQWSRYRGGYGNQVMIDHGWVNGSSLMSSYNHLSSFSVGAGARVSAGQVIGYAGNTGTSAACHLHFEVYVNGGTVNPRPYLGL